MSNSHAGRYTLVRQQNTATSEPSAPGADGRGELGGRVEITAGRLMVESKPSAGAVRTRAASRAGAEERPGAERQGHSNGHAAAHPGRYYPP